MTHLGQKTGSFDTAKTRIDAAERAPRGGSQQAKKSRFRGREIAGSGGRARPPRRSRPAERSRGRRVVRDTRRSTGALTGSAKSDSAMRKRLWAHGAAKRPRLLRAARGRSQGLDGRHGAISAIGIRHQRPNRQSSRLHCFFIFLLDNLTTQKQTGTGVVRVHRIALCRGPTEPVGVFVLICFP